MNPGYPGYPPQPGYGYGMPMMGPQKSTTPRTLGTLSMVFGGLVSVMSLLGLLLGKQVGAMTHVDASQQEAFDRYLHEVHGASMAVSAMMLVMSVALFWIGTGQRGYKRWAVKASLIWGAVALVVLVVNLIVQLTVTLPALDRFIESISHGNMPLPIGKMMKVSAFLGVGFYAPFPIILLLQFRKPAVVQAMDQPPQETPAAGVF